ncbi:MAG: hypothetical protein NTY67_12460 [Cyanobacteria bacterium]|nr:hypothetical protein [Cyanobacteriota bacterium]
MASSLSLTIPASPGWASCLQGLGISLAFSTYGANRLLLLSTAEPADGLQDPHQPCGTPQLKQAASYSTGEANHNEVVPGKCGRAIAPYPELTFPARAAINRRNTSMVRLVNRDLGTHLSSNGHSLLTQEPPLQPPPPQSSSPPDP